MITILSAIFYTIACLLLGVVIIRLLSLRYKIESQFPLHVLLATGFILGLGILANIWLLLGLASWFKVSLIWGILIVVTIFGILLWPFGRWAIWLKIKDEWLKIKKLSFVWKILLVLVILLILVYALGSIIFPPIGDAIAFYMVLPKIMASSEALRPQPNFYVSSQVGLLGEMHYSALMAIVTPEAAKLFTWIASLATAMILLSIGNMAGTKIKGRLITLILLFTSSTLTIYLLNGKADIFSGAFGLAAYYWVLQTDKKENVFPLILTGLFTGLAFVAKFSTAVAIIPGIFLIITWNNYLKCRLCNYKLKKFLLNSFISFLIVGSFMVLMIIPHLIKNWFLFGEPFGPLLYLKTHGAKLFDTPWFSKETTKFILLTYPIALIFGQYPMQEGNLSVFVLALAPLLFFLKFVKNFWQSKLFQVICLALIGLGAWLIYKPSILAPRYIMATLLLFLIPISLATEKVFLSNKLTIIKIMIFLSLLFVISCSIFNNIISYKLTLKKEDRIQFYNPSYKALEFINQRAAKGERIYFAGSFSYYLRSDLLQCLNNQEDYAAIDNSKTWESIPQRGFNYILVQKKIDKTILNLLANVEKPDWLVVQEIYNDPDTTIFSLSSSDLNNHPQCQCQTKNQKYWEVNCQN